MFTLIDHLLNRTYGSCYGRKRDGQNGSVQRFCICRRYYAGLPDQALRKITQYYLMGFPLYVLATGLAFVNANISLGICTALWIFWALKGAYRQAELAKRHF